MKEVKIFVEHNPYSLNSASGNRWKTLIEGLASLNINIVIYVYGGLLFENENAKKTFFNNKINFTYLVSYFPKSYWSVRIYKYVLKGLMSKITIHQALRYIKNEDFIWFDHTLFTYQLIGRIRKNNITAQIFAESSEFMDIHKFNIGNVLQMRLANKRQKQFETKIFYDLNGLALMTRTLLNHYEKFQKPHPKMLHLPMTVDLGRFNKKHEALPEFIKPYIAYVGVMNDLKDGVSILINSFDTIKEKYENYKLYLVGPRTYDTPIHVQLIRDLQLENRVFWMKEYPHEKIPNIICNADLLVLPRPDSKQAQGGFPTKLGEYLATGNPICATSVGEIPDYLEDNVSVFCAKPGSIESFANAMDRALSDPENAKRVGLNGRKVAEREFNKDIQASKLYDFFKVLVEK